VKQEERRTNKFVTHDCFVQPATISKRIGILLGMMLQKIPVADLQDAIIIFLNY